MSGRCRTCSTYMLMETATQPKSFRYNNLAVVVHVHGGTGVLAPIHAEPMDLNLLPKNEKVRRAARADSQASSLFDGFIQL